MTDHSGRHRVRRKPRIRARGVSSGYRSREGARIWQDPWEHTIPTLRGGVQEGVLIRAERVLGAGATSGVTGQKPATPSGQGVQARRGPVAVITPRLVGAVAPARQQVSDSTVRSKLSLPRNLGENAKSHSVFRARRPTDVTREVRIS